MPPPSSPSKAATAFLVMGMLFTGTINTLLNKLQDLQCVDNCQDPEPHNRHYFEQPVWQTLNMFLGEAICLLVYFASKRLEKQPIDTADTESTPLLSSSSEPPVKPMSGWSNLLLWIPTLCDMTATTLMNVGLIYISASIYQMLRGSVVIFTGTFSVLFLNRRHPLYRWFALFTVFVGVGLVGLSSIVQNGSTESVPIKGSSVGVFMVILAQIFTASQFVIEEKILSRYDVAPLKAVGLEGLFGLVSVAIVLPLVYFTIGVQGPQGHYFDLPEGWHQIISYPQVLYAGVGIIFSIAFFNWFGLSVTRSISATSRSTIDTCRTIFIWMSSLALGWESFKWLQVIGFLVLLYGTLMFNDVVQPPWCCPRERDLEEVEREE